MSETQVPNLAILVHTCDRYTLLLHGFNAFFRRFWDRDIPCRCYLGLETSDHHFDGFETLRSGKGEWADRLRDLLQHQIKERYVLVFQEDMWLTHRVHTEFFVELLAWAQANGHRQIKLHSGGDYHTFPTETTLAGLPVRRLDNANSKFLMSHQMTLWDREFLIAQLKPKEHPWRNEREGTKRLRRLNPEIFVVDYFVHAQRHAEKIDSGAGLWSAHGNVSINSRFCPEVADFLPALEAAGGADAAYAAKVRHHLANGLTHDGLPQARKVDGFQRLLNRVKRIWRRKR